MKTCRKCNAPKEQRPNGVWFCRPCGNRQAREYSKRTYDPARQKIKAASQTYGISKEYAAELYSRTVCDSCRLPDPNGKSLHIDHNHSTGEVRGVLCHGCNVSLGSLREDPARIIKLLNYITRNSK